MENDRSHFAHRNLPLAISFCLQEAVFHAIDFAQRHTGRARVRALPSGRLWRTPRYRKWHQRKKTVCTEMFSPGATNPRAGRHVAAPRVERRRRRRTDGSHSGLLHLATRANPVNCENGEAQRPSLREAADCDTRMRDPLPRQVIGVDVSCGNATIAKQARTRSLDSEPICSWTDLTSGGVRRSLRQRSTARNKGNAVCNRVRRGSCLLRSEAEILRPSPYPYTFPYPRPAIGQTRLDCPTRAPFGDAARLCVAHGMRVPD